jgi:hypothetical protein
VLADKPIRRLPDRAVAVFPNIAVRNFHYNTDAPRGAPLGDLATSSSLRRSGDVPKMIGSHDQRPPVSRALPERRVTHVVGMVPRGLARSEGFEPPTPRFEVWCSIQLSYERTEWF